MRTGALLLTLISLSSVSFGATAYEALRAAGREQGEEILHRVTEMRGLEGAPEPQIWHVVLDDPLARGGVRVIDMKGTQIAGERTPITGYTSSGDTSIIKLRDLNLDSSGAFTVAEKTATAQKVGFDRVDYSLRLGSPNGAPVWFLTLTDALNVEVGTLKIAADTGTVLEQHWAPGQATQTFDGDALYVDDPPQRQPQPEPESPAKAEGEKIFDALKHFGKRAERHFRRDGAAVQRFFTGESDVDEGLESPTPPDRR